MGEITRNNGSKSILDDFPVVKFELDKLVKMLPLSLIFVGMNMFNNLCLQYVEVSFYNVSRCLSFVFNVIVTLFILGKSTNLFTGSALIVVILGLSLVSTVKSISP